MVRVLVTGANGLVGRHAVEAVVAAGHDVVASDLAEPTFATPQPRAYVRADLADAAEAFALVGGFAEAERGPKPGPFDAVVHAAAIPAPGRHAPHVVFGNNLLALFNVVEACVRFGVPRLVNVSSETVPGFIFAERPFHPAYLPVDEDHPVTPQDPYGLAKALGEQLCEAAARRSDLAIVSVRSSWVQDADNIAANLGPMIADPDAPSITGWAYVHARDLAELLVLAAAGDTIGHEVVYAAQPDTIGGKDLHATWRRLHPDSPTDLLPVDRPDASGISIARARRLFGWDPSRSWRDHLDEQGRPIVG